MGFRVELSAIAETIFGLVESRFFYTKSGFNLLFFSIIYDFTDFVA